MIDENIFALVRPLKVNDIVLVTTRYLNFIAEHIKHYISFIFSARY